jgi:hypothetical protein
MVGNMITQIERMERMSRFAFLALTASVLMSTLMGCTLRQRGHGPYYTAVDTSVAYLTESTAISIAKETMANEGYDLTVWQVKRSDERRKPDKLVKRFSLDPRQVRVLFSDGKKYREVEVVLQDGRISSSMFFGL